MKIQWELDDFGSGCMLGVVICFLLWSTPVGAIVWAYLGLVIGQTLAARNKSNV